MEWDNNDLIRGFKCGSGLNYLVYYTNEPYMLYLCHVAYRCTIDTSSNIKYIYVYFDFQKLATTEAHLKNVASEIPTRPCPLTLGHGLQSLRS